MKTIVFDVDSSDGQIAGATEFAAEVMAARRRKPVIAVVNFMALGVGYWAIAAATEIVASYSAMVGGIGVFAVHEDLSKALAQLGIRRTYIASGKHKVEGNEAEPLSRAARAALQKRVEATYDVFLKDIAKGRGVPVDVVHRSYGEGRIVGAERALEMGMVDRLASLNETLSRVMAQPPSLTPPPRAIGQAQVADRLFKARVQRELLELQF